VVIGGERKGIKESFASNNLPAHEGHPPTPQAERAKVSNKERNGGGFSAGRRGFKRPRGGGGFPVSHQKA